MLRERLNYLSILCIENDIIEPHEEAFKEYTAWYGWKGVGKTEKGKKKKEKKIQKRKAKEMRRKIKTKMVMVIMMEKNKLVLTQVFSLL